MESINACLQLICDFGNRIRVERYLPSHKLEEKTTNGPNVDFILVLLSLFEEEYFWSHGDRSPTLGLCGLLVTNAFCEAEISDFENKVFRTLKDIQVPFVLISFLRVLGQVWVMDQNVLKLEISVHHIELLHGIKPSHYLLDNENCLRLAHRAVWSPINVLLKLAAIAKLQIEPEIMALFAVTKTLHSVG